MQVNITGFSSSPAIPKHSVTAPNLLVWMEYPLSYVVSVKQEKLYQGVSKTATEIICVLVHLDQFFSWVGQESLPNRFSLDL